jgi:MSHA pilin protein MshA
MAGQVIDRGDRAMPRRGRPLPAGRAVGFTLIEVVAVLVILGVIAAVALPQFANLRTDAEIARARRAAAIFADAIKSQHATWMVRGLGVQAGNGIDFNAAGWPVGTSVADAASAETGVSAQNCAEVLSALVPSIPSATVYYPGGPGVGTAKRWEAYVSVPLSLCAYYVIRPNGSQLVVPGSVCGPGDGIRFYYYYATGYLGVACDTAWQ